MEFWKNGACSLANDKFLKLICSQKSKLIYQLGFYGKNKSTFDDNKSSFPIFSTKGKPLIFGKSPKNFSSEERVFNVPKECALFPFEGKMITNFPFSETLNLLSGP